VSIPARIALLVVLIVASAAAWWRITVHYEGIGYARAQAEAAAAAQAQAQRNRDLQRAAELRYTVQAGVREEFIVTTVKELAHETADLASCRLSPGARRLLNDAAQCARADRPAACGPREPLPGPG
jgi:hypothetical protein